MFGVYEPLIVTLGTVAIVTALMGVITYFRKKAGAPDMDWKNFAKAVEMVAPVVLSIVPGVPPILIPAVVHGIQVAEAIPGATGEQKKAAVIDFVNTGITTTNLTAGKQVIDPTVINAVSNGIDAVVGTVNLVHGKSAAPDADLKP